MSFKFTRFCQVNMILEQYQDQKFDHDSTLIYNINMNNLNLNMM